MVCIFCGIQIRKGTDGNLAEEHVVPKWLQDRIGARHQTILSVTKNLIDGSELQRTHTLERFVAKRVCKKCNNGWMSKLEVDVAKVLEPVFIGTKSVCDTTEPEQQILLRWAMKTALAVIAASPNNDMKPPVDHYRLLAAGGEIPGSVHCIAAQVSGQPVGFGISRLPKYMFLVVPGDTPFDPAEVADSYTCLMYVGNIALALISFSAPQHVVVLDRNLHFPVGRAISEYGWYEALARKQIAFMTTDELLVGFASQVLFARSALDVGEFIPVSDSTCVVTTPPTLSKLPRPFPI